MTGVELATLILRLGLELLEGKRTEADTRAELEQLVAKWPTLIGESDVDAAIAAGRRRGGG